MQQRKCNIEGTKQCEPGTMDQEVENNRGNNFGRGRAIAPAPAGARARIYTMLSIVSRTHS